MRCNPHVNNLVGKLRSISYKFVKLIDILPIETIWNIYFAFYQSILQYGLLTWGGIKDYYLKVLESNQNNILRMILHKKLLEGSSILNYIHIGILLVRYLHKKIALMFIIKNNIIPTQNLVDFSLRAYRAYDIY